MADEQNTNAGRFINAARIIVNELEPDDNETYYRQDDGESSSVVPDYEIRKRYFRDKHLYMMPIASPEGFQGAAAAFVQLAAPTLIMVADWTGLQADQHAVLPASELSNSNWILLDDHYEPAMIEMVADGRTPLYRVSGTYVYGCINPSAEPLDDICFPIRPDYEDVHDRTIDTSRTREDLIECGESQSTLQGRRIV